nr:carbohydrate-binding family 9-like protein [uncultured Desulfobacter sp.]
MAFNTSFCESALTWRANFYKCADKTAPSLADPAPVDLPAPVFHQTRFIGTLCFQ